MSEQKKKIIYFIIIALLALAFIIFYLMDTSIKKNEDSNLFPDLFKIADSPTQNDSSSVKTSENTAIDNNQQDTYIESDIIQVIDWKEVDIDSIYVRNPRNAFTLTRHGFKKWKIKSPRIDSKIPSTNTAIFRLLNIFQHFKADNNLTRDYSELSEFFDNPICTVKTYFKDGSIGKLTFIRIEEYDDFYNDYKLKTWTRVNDQTVVYHTTFNTLERFIVSEKEFLKLTNIIGG